MNPALPRASACLKAIHLFFIVAFFLMASCNDPGNDSDATTDTTSASNQDTTVPGQDTVAKSPEPGQGGQFTAPELDVLYMTKAQFYRLFNANGTKKFIVQFYFNNRHLTVGIWGCNFGNKQCKENNIQYLENGEPSAVQETEGFLGDQQIVNSEIKKIDEALRKSPSHDYVVFLPTTSGKHICYDIVTQYGKLKTQNVTTITTTNPSPPKDVDAPAQ